MKRKLFVFDIDQTIKPLFSEIPDSTKEAIQLIQKHYPVALATGRCFNEAKPVACELNVDYLICNGGSDVYFKNKCLYQYKIDFSSEVNELKNKRPFHFFVGDHGVYSYRYPKFLKHISFFQRFHSKTSSIYGLIGLISQIQDATSLEEMGTLHKFYVFGKYKGTLDYSRHFNYLHTYEYENKALGLQFLIDYFGDIDEVIAFGDSRNDLTMFDLATRCYANEKGNDLLKKKATGLFQINGGIYDIVIKELEF